MADDLDAETRKEHLEFLYASIEDIQGTIRAVDLKLNVLAVILIIPLGGLKDMLHLIAIKLHIFGDPLPSYLFPGAFASVWIAALATVLRGLLGVAAPRVFTLKSDPNKSQSGSGVFYMTGLFKLPWRSVWFADKSISSRKELPELPDFSQDLIKELRFEQATLAYIRDIKLLRAKVAHILSVMWICSWIIIGIANLTRGTLAGGN